MKFYSNNILCLEYDEIVPAIMKADNYQYHRKGKKITVFGRGGGIGSTVLIEYETLPEKYKVAIKEKYGDPYKYVLTKPLTEWVKINWNTIARDFYTRYVLPNGSKLPEQYRDRYTKAITYLDAIQHYTTDKIALKRDFNINMAAFWLIVADVLKAENVHLPKNRIRLSETLQDYKKAGFNTEAGFKLLIKKDEHRFGNENSKKVKDQEAEDVLMKLIEIDNKHDDEVIAASYNLWAAKNGRKTITGSAVAYRRRTRGYEVDAARIGQKAAYNKYSKQIKQSRATSPLMLINSDDNVLDLYFKEISYSNGKKHTNSYYRPVMYVVIDTFNDYILGYAVGETVTIELVKEAYRNAMAHIVDLTGQPHLWHQVKTDKWSIDPKLEGELATFLNFKQQSIFFPAQVAQSKYIERVFGRPLHKVLKVFPNYSGGNITAKSETSRPNPEALQKRSKDFPEKQHAEAVIEMAINTMRHSLVADTEQTRQQQWLDAFMQSDFCKSRAITNENRIELFGKKHQPHEPARLTVSGLNFQINNVKYSYDVPAALFPENLNKRVEITYDPTDMSQVLVTDNKGLRFVASAYKLQPAALADMTPGDGAMRDERMQEKEAIMNKLNTYVTDRDARLERAKIDASSLVQAGVLTKAINHKAQKVLGGYEDCLTPSISKGEGEVVEKSWSIYDEM
jgi:hypothetical protein